MLAPPGPAGKCLVSDQWQFAGQVKMSCRWHKSGNSQSQPTQPQFWEGAGLLETRYLPPAPILVSKVLSPLLKVLQAPPMGSAVIHSLEAPPAWLYHQRGSPCRNLTRWSGPLFPRAERMAYYHSTIPHLLPLHPPPSLPPSHLLLLLLSLSPSLPPTILPCFSSPLSLFFSLLSSYLSFLFFFTSLSLLSLPPSSLPPSLFLSS